MKFIDKQGAVYKVIPDNKVFIATKEDGKDINIIREIEEHEQRSVVEASLFNYAKENSLIPAFAAEIRDSSSLVFQGEVIQAHDAIKLTSDAIVEKVQEYFELKKDIDDLTTTRDSEVKEVKTEYNDKISTKDDAMEVLEPVVRTGLESLEVDASWERDVESEMMVLIRQDTLKALKCKPMDAEEKQKNDLLEPKPDEDATKDVEEETDEVFNNDTVPEPEITDEKEQTD